MEIFFGLFFNLIPLAIIAAVVYVIVQRRRRDTSEMVDPGIGTVRRLYFYTVSFVALMMAANGLVQIAQYVLEALFGGDVISESQTRLAIGASLTIVGLPLWVFHWRLIQRHVGELPVEKRSLIRKFYIYLVLGVAVGLAIAASVSLLQWAFGSKSFSGYPWAAVIVWSVVWAFHWRLESAEGQPTSDTRGVRRLYLYLVSLATLVMLAAGFGRVVHIILLEGYESLVSLSVLLPADTGLWRPSMRAALAWALIGGTAWGAHWLYFARHDFGSVMRQFYLYIFAILGGVVTILVSLGLIINGVMTWLMGTPTDDASVHFRFLPGALASLAVGLSLWAYHWTVVRQKAEASALESQDFQRAYAYILAGMGLGALVVGIGTLVHAVLVIFTETTRELLAGQDLWREPLALGITLGILGMPLWGYFWTSIQRRVSTEGVAERSTLGRRIFIHAVLAAGILALLGSVSALIFLFLRDLLADELSRETLRDARPAIDIIAAIAIFLPYYWMVYRQDRLAEPEAIAPAERRIRKEVAVLVQEGGEAFVPNLETALGYRVTILRWVDPDAIWPELSEAACEELARRVTDANGERVLLVPDGAAVRVLSYD